MKSKLQLLQEESLRIGLDQSERDSLRNSLLSYIEQNPIEDTPEESPYASYARSRQSSRPAWLFAVVVGAVALVLVTGVTYAAERSTPGDMLYSMKKGVNERVLGILAFSDNKKAELEVTLADRRLEEAEKLNAEAQLTEEAKVELSQSVTNHLKAAGTHVEKMVANKNFAAVEKATAQLETALNEHARILPMLSLVGNASSSQSTDAQ